WLKFWSQILVYKWILVAGLQVLLCFQPFVLCVFVLPPISDCGFLFLVAPSNRSGVLKPIQDAALLI
ncbi:hypothetical protein U1Q18_019000, partial [Sarracenia purpurea var. burkii]